MQLTMEAIDVAGNNSLWVKSLTVPAEDHVALHDQVTSNVTNGLIPALGVSTADETGGTRPKNDEAYDLYLRSIALAHDGAQNDEAIRMLERSVGLDSTFAPALAALGIRYYYDEEYGSGIGLIKTATYKTDPTSFRSYTTLQRALALDPNLVNAEQQIISQDTDRGNLVHAYRQAKAMVARHPQSGIAHFTLSYVLRYGSVLDEARNECDAAIRLDPGNYMFRSCSALYVSDEKSDRAKPFFDLDTGSEWHNNINAIQLLRTGKTDEALARIRLLPDSSFFHGRAIEACYSNPRPANYQELMDKLKKDLLGMSDPEPRYSQALTFDHCLGNEFSIPIMRGAVKDGFCAYEQLEADVKTFPNLRKSPDFPALMTEAKACRDKFLADRDKLSSLLSPHGIFADEVLQTRRQRNSQPGTMRRRSARFDQQMSADEATNARNTKCRHRVRWVVRPTEPAASIQPGKRSTRRPRQRQKQLADSRPRATTPPPQNLPGSESTQSPSQTEM